MNNFTDWLVNIYNSFGFNAVLVIILTILFTNILKRPLVKYAGEYALKYNVDKSVITKWIALFPYVLSFFINLIYVLAVALFKDVWNVDWGAYISNSALFASLSIAGFEIGKKCLESYVSRKEAKNGK